MTTPIALLNPNPTLKVIMSCTHPPPTTHIYVCAQVVISGAEEGVGEVERQALAGRVARRCVRLAVSAPFHCSLLTPSQGPFAHALGAVALARPVVPVLSNVTAGDVSKLAPEDVKDLLVQQVGCLVLAWVQQRVWVWVCVRGVRVRALLCARVLACCRAP